MPTIVIPMTLYSLEDAREEMEFRSEHPYRIETVRKAVRRGTLRHHRIDERTVVVTSDAIEEYLRKYGKFTRGKWRRRK